MYTSSKIAVQVVMYTSPIPMIYPRVSLYIAENPQNTFFPLRDEDGGGLGLNVDVLNSKAFKTLSSFSPSLLSSSI